MAIEKQEKNMILKNLNKFNLLEGMFFDITSRYLYNILYNIDRYFYNVCKIF